jgi:hypothetical protein
MVQEPPKYGDWLPGATGAWVNVSRRPEFAITLSDRSQQEYSSTTTFSAWATSGSVAIAAEES